MPSALSFAACWPSPNLSAVARRRAFSRSEAARRGGEPPADGAALHNGTVRDYNTVVESFPSNVVAGAFGFTLADFFRSSALERAVPQVRT